MSTPSFKDYFSGQAAYTRYRSPYATKPFSRPAALTSRQPPHAAGWQDRYRRNQGVTS